MTTEIVPLPPLTNAVSLPSTLLVTALYDLAALEESSNRRTLDEYLTRGLFLRTLPHPLLVFTDPQLEPKLKEMFATNLNIHVIGLPWGKLRYTDRVDQIRTNMTVHPFHTNSDNKTTAFYSIMMWNKFEFVYQSYLCFPLYTNYVWLDFGLGGVIPHPSLQDLNQVLATFDDSHFCCTIINPLAGSEYNDDEACFGAWHYRQVGGFWSVGRHLMDFFVSFVRNEVDQLLHRQRVCMDEEIMARFSYAHPARCKFSFGDYVSCVSNWLGLKSDVDVAKRAIEKAHRCGLHHMAAAGLEQLLNSYNQGWIPWSTADVIHYAITCYIELYYVDAVQARKLAIQIVHWANEYESVRAHYLSRPELYRNNLRYVLSDQELTEWGPDESEDSDLKHSTTSTKQWSTLSSKFK